MRLICPNCDAQYEIDAAMIPASGRDVQCSNCGKTWFQGPEETIAIRAPETEAEEQAPETRLGPDPERDEDGSQDRSGDGLGDEAAAFFSGSVAEQSEDADPEHVEAEPAKVDEEEDSAVLPGRESEAVETEAAASVDATDESIDRDEGDRDSGGDDGDDADDNGDPAPERERPPIDPSVLGILRAEAEREIAARRAEEAAGIETQGDLGLDGSEPEPVARSDTRIRTARLRGLDEDGDAQEARTAILPDIDDINASLTATSDRGIPDTPAEVAEQVQKRRSGFRTGFTMVLSAVAAIILIYLFAPQIATAIPALEPALTAYVDWANGMRLALDAAMDRTATSLDGG
ncbi:MAG: zinc-ribbon domain-containing protein [Pseudomonadota bacterium]